MSIFVRLMDRPQRLPPPAGIPIELWQLGMALGAIFVVTTINILGTTWAGKVQVVGTVIKVGALAVLIAMPIVLRRVDFSLLTPMWPAEFNLQFAQGILTAMVGILWAYDGWINITPLAEEVSDPGRNLPRALIGGMAILIAIYLSMTLAYHVVLPIHEIGSLVDQPAAKAVAADYCRTLVGSWGVQAISVVVMISTFISLNGNALTGPRSYFAMARDGIFPAKIAEIHPRFQTPANAILLQSGWAVVLTILGTALIVLPEVRTSGLPEILQKPAARVFSQLHKTPLYDLLYTYVIFGATLFYMLAIGAVFILRAKMPDLPRPYLTWGYPWTPLIYLAASLLLLGNMLYESPVESVGGLILILAGLPAYALLNRKPH
jgi:APA family basic amino acid/polyamine antiporter